MVARVVVTVALSTALARAIVQRPIVVEHSVTVPCDAAWFAPTVTVTADYILFDGALVATIDSVLRVDGPYFYIEPIDDRLKAHAPAHLRTAGEIARNEATRSCDRGFCPGRSVIVRLRPDTRPELARLIFHTITRNGYEPVVLY